MAVTLAAVVAVTITELPAQLRVEMGGRSDEAI